MSAHNIAIWFTAILLLPGFWAIGLLVLAFIGDLVPGCKSGVSRLFDKLEGRSSRVPTAMPNEAAG